MHFVLMSAVAKERISPSSYLIRSQRRTLGGSSCGKPASACQAGVGAVARYPETGRQGLTCTSLSPVTPRPAPTPLTISAQFGLFPTLVPMTLRQAGPWVRHQVAKVGRAAKS